MRQRHKWETGQRPPVPVLPWRGECPAKCPPGACTPLHKSRLSLSTTWRDDGNSNSPISSRLPWLQEIYVQYCAGWQNCAATEEMVPCFHRPCEFKPQDSNRDLYKKKEKCSHTNIRRICSRMHPFQQLLLSFDASCSPFLDLKTIFF